MQPVNLFHVARLALFAMPSVASMLEVFRGVSCEETPTGRSQLLYAHEPGYTWCGRTEGYETNIVIRSGEAPDNPTWPYCEWTFYSDTRCQKPIVTLDPSGQSCACATIPFFKTYRILCRHEPFGDEVVRPNEIGYNLNPEHVNPDTGDSKKRSIDDPNGLEAMPLQLNFDPPDHQTLARRNFSEPSYMTNQSSSPDRNWENGCERGPPPFRVGLAFTSGQMARNVLNVFVDQFEIVEHGDPEFVGHILHGVYRTQVEVMAYLHKNFRTYREFMVEGPLKAKVLFTVVPEPEYALHTLMDTINQERFPTVLYVLYHTMRRQSIRAVKFRLASTEDGFDTPMGTFYISVQGSVP